MFPYNQLFSHSVIVGLSIWEEGVWVRRRVKDSRSYPRKDEDSNNTPGSQYSNKR